MPSVKSTSVATRILNDFAQTQLLLDRKELRKFIRASYVTIVKKKLKKWSKVCAKKILRDRKDNTGLYDTVEKMAEYLDDCFLPPEIGDDPKNPYSMDVASSNSGSAKARGRGV